MFRNKAFMYNTSPSMCLGNDAVTVQIKLRWRIDKYTKSLWPCQRAPESGYICYTASCM